MVMGLLRVLLILTSFFLWSKVWGFVLPTQLNQEGKLKVVDILSFGTLTKLNSNPYPLGGYSGLEIGFSQEAIASSKLSQLGAEDSSSGYFTYANLSIGKGFYSNWDIFLSFAPFGQGIQSQIYGLMFRWCFWNSPVYRFSAVLHANGTNIQNKYFSEGSGFDLVSSATWRDFDAYLGLGPASVSATFSNALLAPGEDARIARGALRHYYGVSYRWDEYFFALESHTVREKVYSLKLGLRF